MKPRIAFYGDDFTGSADVMEVLQWSGVPTVLFIAPPTKAMLATFDRFEAFGVAGRSRSMSPDEMDKELKPMFAHLRDSGARIIHYKTCSTFDSSPEIGSIGRAIEIGREVFGSDLIPVVIGAPNLGRYQVFGNLFARSGLDTEPFRLDRHPTMMHHPITPMAEADLRMHLAKQTSLSIGLYDILRLESDESSDELSDEAPDELKLNRLPDVDALLFDVLFEKHLPRIGQIIDQLCSQKPSRFVVGSSGIEYALTQFWRAREAKGSDADASPTPPTFDSVDQLVAITGSCSPVNDRQITWAQQNGFESIPLNPARLIDPEVSESEIESSVDHALQRLATGANVILHSSRGPHDLRIEETKQKMRAMGYSEDEIRLRSGELLGVKLGRILKRILSEQSFPRVGIAGGDTSGFIARELEIIALEAIAPVAPGSPLCRAHANNALDGVEFFFKGGQVGKDNVWGTMLHGSSLGSFTR
jgi:3-oxoisoapionate kinase